MLVTISWPVKEADPNLRAWRIYGNSDPTVDVKGRFIVEVPASESSAVFPIEEGWWEFRVIGVYRAESETNWRTAEARISGLWNARGAGNEPDTPTNVAVEILEDGDVHVLLDPPQRTTRPVRMQVIGGPVSVISDPGLGYLIGEFEPKPAGPQETDAASQLSPAFKVGGLSGSDAFQVLVRPISIDGCPGDAVARDIRPGVRPDTDPRVVASIDRTAGTYVGFPAPTVDDGHEASATYGFRARSIPAFGSPDWADGWGTVDGTGLWSQLRAIGRYMDNGTITTEEIDLGSAQTFALDLFHEAHRRDGVWSSKPMREWNTVPAFPYEHPRVRRTTNSAAWTMREMLWGGIPRQPLRDVWWEYVSTTTGTLTYVEADWRRAIPGQWLHARKFRVRLKWFEPIPWFRFATGSVAVGVLLPDNTDTGTGSPEGVVYGGRGKRYIQTGSSPNRVWIKGTQTGNTGWIPQAVSTELASYLPLAGGTMAGDVAMGGHKVTGLGTPTASGDAATKDYVDALAYGAQWKAPVRVASTANVSIASGLESFDTIDGVTLATGDRVLLKNQTTASENGIYIVAASGAASRAPDANTSALVLAGLAVIVDEGTANADTAWILTTNNPITLGSTALTFTQFGAGSTPDADATTKGKVQLAGDLGGTAASPSVVKVAGVTPGAGGLAILDDANAGAVRTTLGVGTSDTPQLAGIEVGHASDTTLARDAAGDLSVEGKRIYRDGGTDVPVADGGTGSSTASGARTNLGLGSVATLDSDTDGTLAANSDGKVATQKATKTYVDSMAPIGAIILWSGNSGGSPITPAGYPSNWHLVDGAAISRSTYATLFALIGTTYGVGDGSTTFNLPNLDDIFPKGWKSGGSENVGATGGSKTPAVSITDPGHTHTETTTNAGRAPGTAVGDGLGTGASATGISASIADGRPPFLSLPFLIRIA